jgi:hypothetical protein
MGYIRHHAIVVTTFKKELTEQVHQKAVEIFGVSVSNIVPSQINGDYSFFVGPDGSKAGWKDDEDGDTRRNVFFEYIKRLAYDDGSNSVDYAELFYGDDEGNAGIVRHN